MCPTLLATGPAPPEEGELRDPKVGVEAAPLFVRFVLVRTRPLSRGCAVCSKRSSPASHTVVGQLPCLGPDVWTGHSYHGHVLDSYFRRPVERVFLAIERRLARSAHVLIAILFRTLTFDVGERRSESSKGPGETNRRKWKQGRQEGRLIARNRVQR